METLNLLVQEELENIKLPSIELTQMWTEQQDRRLVIDFDIDDRLLMFSRYIIEWNKQDKDIPIEERKKIFIYCYSFGGDLYSATSFYTIANMSKTPCIFVNMGVCASAMAIIYLSGKIRYAMPNSQFLLHEGTLSLDGQTTKVMENLEMFQKVEKDLEKHIVNNTGISSTLYKKMKKKEWWLRAEEALELKVCDKIIESLDELYVN